MSCGPHGRSTEGCHGAIEIYVGIVLAEQVLASSAPSRKVFALPKGLCLSRTCESHTGHNIFLQTDKRVSQHRNTRMQPRWSDRSSTALVLPDPDGHCVQMCSVPTKSLQLPPLRHVKDITTLCTLSLGNGGPECRSTRLQPGWETSRHTHASSKMGRQRTAS